jgi:hypothetical protein
MEVCLQSFLTSALGGGVSLASCPGHSAAGREPQHLLNVRLCGPQKYPGCFGGKITSACLASDTRFVPAIPTCQLLCFFFNFREINGMTVCFKCGPSVAPVNKPAATQPSQLLYRYDHPLSVVVSNV